MYIQGAFKKNGGYQRLIAGKRLRVKNKNSYAERNFFPNSWLYFKIFRQVTLQIVNM